MKTCLALFALGMALASQARSQCTSYPNTLTNGSSADANQVMANFNCAALLGGASFTGAITVNTTAYPAINITSTATAGLGLVHGSTAASVYNDGNMHVEGDGNIWLNHDSGGNVFMVAGGGEVGIGTSSPTATLTVQSPGNTGAAYLTVLPQNLTESVNVGYNHIWESGSNGNNDLYIDSQASGPLVLQGNGGSGNVGITNGSPLALLDLGGAITTIKLAVFDGGGSTNIYGVGVNPNELTFGAGISVGGTPQMVLTNGGYLGVGTASPSYTLHVNGTAYATGAAGALSDIRHKSDIQPLPPGALGLVEELRPVSFFWKTPMDDGMKGKQMGFIAQEVEPVLPSVVLTEGDADKTKDIKYQEIIPVLTKAIQEQQAEIAALQAEVAALKRQRSGS